MLEKILKEQFLANTLPIFLTVSFTALVTALGGFLLGLIIGLIIGACSNFLTALILDILKKEGILK